jgi:sulfite reductase (NADPH) flavoprotein alpha-component
LDVKISTAILKERYLLTKEGSTKAIYHISLCVDKAVFKSGDSLAIFGQNDPTRVNEFIDLLGLKGDELIRDPRSKEEMSVKRFFTYKAHLFRLTSAMVRLACELDREPARKKEISTLLQQENLKDYLASQHPVDFFQDYPVAIPIQELCNSFAPLLPRFYSVASSPLIVTNEIDLTVTLNTYFRKGQQHYGVASYFLCCLAEEQCTPIPFYVQTAHRFSLPLDRDADIIMVGSGTGVAPFRAFMQERVQLGSRGRSWLFFGECHSAFDFFYEEYWRSLVAGQFLRLSTAFSRDQDKKIYVQDRMLEEARDLFRWLEGGAYFYVCGDAQEMAKDVDRMLHQIISIEGNRSEEGAKEYVRALKKAGRYLLDVY